MSKVAVPWKSQPYLLFLKTNHLTHLVAPSLWPTFEASTGTKIVFHDREKTEKRWPLSLPNVSTNALFEDIDTKAF